MPEALTPQPSTNTGASTPSAQNGSANAPSPKTPSNQPVKPKSFRDVESFLPPEGEASEPAAKTGLNRNDDEDFGDDDDDLGEGEEGGEEGLDEEADEENLEADAEEEGADDEESDAEDDEESDGSEPADVNEVLSAIEKEIGKDGKFEVKVNGKKERYSLSDMKKLVSSGAHTIAKHKEFETFRKTKITELQETHQELQRLNNEISPVFTKLKEGNVRDAIYDLANHAGMTSLQFRRKLLQQMMPIVADRLGLSDEVVQDRLSKLKDRNEALDLKEENAFNSGELERLKKASTPKEASVEEKNKQAVRNLQIQHGYSDQDIKWAVNFFKKDAEASGKQPHATLDDVHRLLSGKKFADRTNDAVESVRPELMSDKAFLDRVFRKVIKNPDWTAGKVARWVEKQARELADKKKSQGTQSLHKDISRKVKKNFRTTARFENPSKAQRRPMKFSDFGDTDDLG